MAFSHPSRHLPKFNMELLILGIAAVLLLIGLLVMHLSQNLPRERAVPQPVVAGSSLPIYFSKLQGTQSITEPSLHTIRSAENASALEAAISELLAGPSQSEREAGYYTEIPQGTQLLNITDEGNRITINLSREFTLGGGSTSMLQRVEELKSTVRAIENNKQLTIVVEGHPLNTLGGEGLEIN